MLRQFDARRRSRHADRRACASALAGKRHGRHGDRRDRARADALDVVADEEALPFRDGSLDLVVSALALQCVNDLPGTLSRSAARSSPTACSSPRCSAARRSPSCARPSPPPRAEIEGGVSPRVAPFADVRELGALLQRAGFALPVADVDRLTVRYAIAVRADARPAPHGRDQCADRAPAHAAPARDAAAHGGDLRASASPIRDGRIRATFEIIWLSGWAPHESQQKPLQARLGADAARRRARHTRDRSAGEKAGE